MAQNFLSDIKLGDDIYIRLGDATNGDLQIYHDGDHSYIADAGTGELRLRSDGISIQSANGNEYMAFFAGTGSQAVSLYAGNAVKFQTASTGVVITGNADPATDSLYDLGTDTVRWANIYADNYYGDGSNLTGVAADESRTIILTVKNKSGGSLSKGTLVHASPSATPPSGNVIEVVAAENDVEASMPALGALNETLADEAEGECVVLGSISGISTTDDGTSSGTLFSIGDFLYVSDTAGLFTNVKPTGTKLIQKIGIVIKAHATNGTVEIFGAGRTNDVPTPLYIDHANQRVGIGATSPLDEVHISKSVNGDTTLQIENANAGTGARANLHLQSDASRLDIYATSSTYNGVASWVDAGVINAGTPSSGGLILNSQAGGIKFQTATNERMRLDSSGNFLVAKTSANNSTVGVELKTDGSLNPTVDGDTVARFNRLTSDGEIIRLQKDTTTVGVIGTQNWGIGTASPVSKFETKDGDVRVTTLNSFSKFKAGRASIPSAGGFNLGGLHFEAYSTGTTYTTGSAIESYADGSAWTSTSTPSYLSFQTVASSSTSLTERMRIASDGTITFNAYGAGYLKTDANGVISVDTSVVDGSGTANDVVMWSDSNTLTDAPIAISGNNATFAGDITLSKASTPIIKVQDTTNNHYLFMAADDNNSFMRSDGTLLFQVGAASSTVTALNFASDGDATFGGNNINIDSGGGTPSLKITRNLGSGISPGVSLGFINIENSASTGSDNRAVIFEGFTDGGSANATGGGLRLYTKNASTGSNTVAITVSNNNNVTLHGSTYTNTIYSLTNSAYYIDVVASGTGLNMAGGAAFGGGATFGGGITISKSVGDAVLTIEADSDNDNENDNPRIELKQDSGIIYGHFGINGDANATFTGAGANYTYIRAAGGLDIATDGSTKALTIDNSQNATFAGAVSIDGKLTLDAGSLTNGIINTPASLRINIDSNNNNTGEKFVVGHNQDSINNNNELFVVEETGNATIAGTLTVEGAGNSAISGDLYVAASKKYISTSSSSGDYIRLYAAGGTGEWDIYGNGANLRFSENSSNGGGVVIDTDLTVSGNLYVTGTSTTVNVEDLNVEANEITLNYAASSDTSSSANGAGIRIQDAVDATTDATMSWDTSSDRFDFSHALTTATGTVRFTHQQNGGSRLELYNNRQDLSNVEVYRIAAYNSVEVTGVHFYRGGGGSSGYTKIFSKKNNSSSLEEVVQFGTNDALDTTFAGTVRINAVNDAYNFKAFGQDADSWFGVYDDANNSANIILTRSDTAEMFKVMGHTGNTTIAGDLDVGNLRIVSGDDSADQGKAWIRSNGDYLVLNAVDGDHVYLNWDTTNGGGSGHAYILNNLYAKAFYDRVDTNYYLDPAGGSNLAGGITVDGNSMFDDNLRVNGWIKGASDTNTLYSSSSFGTLLQTPGNTAGNNNSKIFFRDNLGNNKHTFDTNNGNATFSGSVTVESGSINNVIQYTKAYSSLDTTGQAVAGLGTSSNGASAMFVFETAGGGEGGYQKIVYNCINVSGTWAVYKDIDEGGNRFDITGSGGTTVTFTFKGRTANQSYTPRVVIKALGGSAINTSYI